MEKRSFFLFDRNYDFQLHIENDKFENLYLYFMFYLLFSFEFRVFVFKTLSRYD